MNKRLNYIQGNYKELEKCKEKQIICTKSKDKYKLTKNKNYGTVTGTKLFKNGKQVGFIQRLQLNISAEEETLEYTTFERIILEEKNIYIHLKDIELDIEFQNYKITGKENNYKIFFNEDEIENIMSFSLYISVNENPELQPPPVSDERS